MDRAKIKGKAAKLVEWAKSWPGFDGYLKLNALVNQENDSSLNVVVNDRIITEYIDGRSRREFTAQIKVILPWSDGYDNVNIQAQELMESLLDWIDEQYPYNLPKWENCDIYQIEPQSNAPQLNYVNEQDELAEYSVQFVIRYEE